MSKEKKKFKLFRKKKHISESKIIEDLKSKYKSIDEANVTKFTDLPLSQRTIRGLNENSYIHLTDIQRQSIGLALQGSDILGAAKTGSGKTLAFLIPVLETLYCKQWTRLDGLGALIITPTRELAYQIYETLRKIGHHHDLSAGLIIGGKDLKFEKKRMDQCNIVICTPGRLLQHMDENPLFDCINMQIIVLDEADRCLDMGFEKTLNSIIRNLPPKRQSLLFSATQTKSVRDLARLSLKNPLYVSVHEHATYTTPENLQQSYLICELEEKISILWSFIKNNLKQKTIVFFSTCKQVKYVYESFCRLRPGVSLLAFYGKLHQEKRMNIYDTFCRKEHAVLFATDIAARGLDFPAINWVVQMDCPEDTNAYIHRAGRTARFQRGGESLLVLLPSEIAIIDKLKQRKIPIELIKINANKLQSPYRKLTALLLGDEALKETAKRAFTTYIKSIYLMKDKDVFDIYKLNTDSFAKSLGLLSTPKVRFLEEIRKRSTVPIKSTNDNSLKLKDMDKLEDNKKVSNNNDKLSESDIGDFENSEEDCYQKNLENILNKSDSDDELIFNTIRNSTEAKEIPNVSEIIVTERSNINNNMKPITKVSIAKKIIKSKKVVPNKKIIYDEEGQEVIDATKTKVSKLAAKHETDRRSGINMELAREILHEEDHFDKQRFREKIKEKHREEKRKLKEKKRQEISEEEDEEEGDGEGEGEGEEEEEEEEEEAMEQEEESNNEERRGKLNEDSEDSINYLTERAMKRKLLTTKEHDEKRKRRKSIVYNNCDFKNDEDLALQLLAGKM